MTLTAPPLPMIRTVPRTLWLALVALLLGVQALGSVGTPASHDDREAQTMRVTAVAPVGVQLRDATRSTIAGTRDAVAKLRGASAGGAPSLAPPTLALTVAEWFAVPLGWAIRVVPSRPYRAADRYRARAPPGLA